ncbi:MAG TPA: sugar ABC transporter permease, partial [Ruminococcaceae bacterium]|nr:sugar ABC transporter permease [Oscillospiraceae bacterium]
MKKTWTRSRQKSVWGVLFVLPCFLIIFLFVIYP